MAGKGYNYADDYDDDWYDQGECSDEEADEDPELAAAVRAAEQQKKAAKPAIKAPVSSSKASGSAQALVSRQSSSSSNQPAGGGLRTAAGAGASALAHYLCDPPGPAGKPLHTGRNGARAAPAVFPAAPRQEPSSADAPEPFRFDTPSPDDAVLLARSGQRHAQQQQHARQPRGPAHVPAATPTPAEQLREGVQALQLRDEDEAVSEGQGRAGIKPAEGDAPSTSGRTEQPAPQRQRRRPLSEYAPEPDLAAALAAAAAAEEAGGKPRLHLVVLGHVDAGKSTLMGRLLHDLGHVSQKAAHKAQRDAAAAGKGSFGWAWLLDERPEERARGVTVDVAASFFETPARLVRLLDAPGHRDFVPNMIAGAAQADAALLLVDGSPGGFEAGFGDANSGGANFGTSGGGGQTREHAQLARSLGIEQLAVVVSKLDTCGYSQERYEQIKQTLQPFLRASGFRDAALQWLPAVGPSGQNLVAPPTEPDLAAWWHGPTVVQAIDAFKPAARAVAKPLRLPISDVFSRARGGVAVGGKLEAGALMVGTRVLVQPGGHAGSVRSVEVNGAPVPLARAGDTADVALAGVDASALACGGVLCHPGWPARLAARLEARIVVLDAPVPLILGRQVSVHVHAAHEAGRLSRLISLLHPKSGEVVRARPRALAKGATALVEVSLNRPLCLEAYADYRALGRIALRDGGRTLAVGVVTALLEEA